MYINIVYLGYVSTLYVVKHMQRSRVIIRYNGAMSKMVREQFWY